MKIQIIACRLYKHLQLIMAPKLELRLFNESLVVGLKSCFRGLVKFAMKK